MQKAGGTFTLTADVDFGATYGLKSVYFKSRNTPSTAGIVRLGNNESVGWRNAANSANLELKVNASNKLEFDGQDIPTLDIGAADTVLQMNAGGTTWEFAKIANDNVDASAAIAYSKLNLATSIVNADVAVAAAIARSKLASGTASYVLINSGAGVMSEEQYLDRTRGGTGITSTATFPSSGTVTTDAGTSVLTNKDFDGGTASNTSRITVPKAAFATIDGLTDKEGTIAFDTDAKKLVVNDGSAWNAVGSGSSGRNYLSDWYDASKSESVGTSAATSTGNRTVAGNTDPTKWVTSDLTNLTFARSADTTLRQSYNYLINSGDANADFVESPLFTLDGRDLGKPISVSFDCAGVSASDDYQVCAVRYNSSGTYQEVITIAGTASATTPYSARIPVGTTSFNGFFIAGATATDQYAIRFMKHAVNVDLRIDSLYVGPNTVVQGAAVCEIPVPTITWTNATGLTPDTSSMKCYRVGKRMNLVGIASFTGTGSDAGALTMSLTGYSWGTTGGVAGWMRAEQHSTTYAYNFFVYKSTTSNLTFYTQSIGSVAATTLKGTDMSNATSGEYKAFYMDVWLDISTWDDGVIIANRAVEDFLYNTGTTATAGGSNSAATSAYGPSGTAILSIASTTANSSTYFDITLPSTAQQTDLWKLEVTNGFGGWIDAPIWITQGTSKYGMLAELSSATNMRVYFGNKGARPNNATYAGDGEAWSGYSGYKWRVRKIASGASVGYPVSTANIVGRTDGVTVGSGYIGEKISASLSNTSLATTVAKSVTGTLTLTPGIWLIRAQGHFDGTGSTTWASQSILSISTTTDTLDVNAYVSYEPTSLRDHLFQVSRLVNISASTPYYLVAQCVFGASTAQIAAANSFFEAVRIA